MLRPWKLEIQLDHQSDQALYLQIADAIIADIQSGRLQPGTALPGSRALAKHLQLNRNTVVEALNVLLNEEWLVSKERKGTFVADILPAFSANDKKNTAKKSVDTGTLLLQTLIDDGSPDSKIAPVAELARAYRQIFNRKAKWQIMGYSSEFGEVGFRKAMAQMLNHQRGMQINEQQICITRGSQMAMYLTAQCLFQPGDVIMVENPGYKPAWKAFENAGARLLPINVDENGIVVAEVERCLKKFSNIKAIYITPHHQYPTTVTLSLPRRLALIRLSNFYGFTIIEDDYDNEFHFGYRPILPLSSYAELKNYVYIGTMSKVVAPALRIGYLVTGDQWLMQKVGTLRKIIDVQGDSIMEQAVLQLIQDGTVKRHLKKATHYYKNKRDLAEKLLNKYLVELVDFVTPDGGLAFWIVPKKKVNWQLVDEKVQQKGFKIILPDTYSYDKTVNGIRLGYAYLSEEQLKESVKVLAQVLSP
jgi:GntR family transcriptional regulator/MocR family aminotransferase